MAKHKLAEPAGDGASDGSSSEDDRPVCKYGAKCYRKNAAHLNTYSHPHKKKVCSVILVYLVQLVSSQIGFRPSRAGKARKQKAEAAGQAS